MKIRPLFIILCYSFGRSTADYQPGNIPTLTSVSHGRLDHEITIELPRGINGLQAEMKFEYHNGLESGIMGLSWDVSGFGRIQRCHSTMEQTGSFDPNSYCFNSVLLVPIAPGSQEFRTVIDSYSKIVVTAADNTGKPSQFTVWRKDQTIETYGGTADSIMVGSVWLLKSIADRFGNTVVYSYMQDGNYLYPQTVVYGNAQVAFNYDARSPRSFAYYGGTDVVTMAKLLTSVISTINGNVARKWTLGYDSSQTRGSSPLLTSLTVCGFDDLCLKPHLFTYQTTDAAVKLPGSSRMINEFGYDQGWDRTKHLHIFADVNNDGFTDVVAFGETAVFVARYIPDQRSFEPSRQVLTDFTIGQEWRVNDHPRSVVDINGDGRPDIVGFGDHGVLVSLNDGAGSFGAPQIWSNDFGTADGWGTQHYMRQVVDMNGDGLPDLIGNDNTGWYVAISTGNNFSVKQQWSNSWPTALANGYVTITDVDGDTLPDVLHINSAGSNMLKNTGSGLQITTYVGSDGYFRSDTTSIPAGWYQNITVTDINGDNLPDIVGLYCPSQNTDCGTTKYIRVSLNSGSGFAVSSTQEHNEIYGNDFVVSDVNADGLKDLILFANDGVHVFLHNGVGYSDFALTLGEFGVTAQNPSKTLRGATDMTGDGLPDVLAIGTDGIYVAQNGQLPPYVNVIKDSFDNTRETMYEPLTRANLYISIQQTYPYTEKLVPRTVVSELRTYHAAGEKNVSQYQYTGLVSNLRGLGTIGFASMTSKRALSPSDFMTTTINYDTKYPSAGFVLTSSMLITVKPV